MTIFRVSYVRAFANTRARTRYYIVKDVDEAIAVITEKAKEDLNDNRVWGYDFLLEEWDENCQAWMEYHDNEGRDIHEIMDEREEQSNNEGHG